MTYRPSIYIQSHTDDSQHACIGDEIMCKWPCGLPPTFSSASPTDCDVALLYADNESILETLPCLLELHSKSIPIVLCCDDLGCITEIIRDLDVTRIDVDTAPSLLAGILFGLLQRNEEVSQLRGQVGFVRKLHCSLQDDLDVLNSELETAATIQREFMSNDVQEVHGISFSTLWRPASVVSGDMYDITKLDDDHVAFFIADAIGHGISAAMLAMMLTRTLSANRFDGESGTFTQPKDVLNHLNSALLERNGDDTRFATAWYGILNCKTNRLTYAGAGHPPALLSRFGNTPHLLESEGPLLGVFSTDDFPQQEVQLAAGDTLLLYSDGFEHALGNEEHAQNELPTFLQSMHGFCKTASGDVLANINEYLNSSIVNEAEDDLTMICLRAKPTMQTLGLAA
jgi:phosphoserine phosphatase RsbU/P